MTMSCGNAVARDSRTSSHCIRNACVLSMMTTALAASLYFRALLQAVSTFLDNGEKTKARSGDGGVKVFTFCMD